MRIFNARLRISDLSNERTREIDALVDTGSTYSVLPASLLEEIGIVPTGAITFKLADGRTIDMRLGEARAATTHSHGARHPPSFQRRLESRAQRHGPTSCPSHMFLNEHIAPPVLACDIAACGARVRAATTHSHDQSIVGVTT